MNIQRAARDLAAGLGGKPRHASITPGGSPAHRNRPGHSWMNVSEVTRISGALLFRPTPHVDERGFFSRTFDAEVAREAGIDPAGFAQDSLSRSVRGVVRGLHVRRGAGEAKLVRCSYGGIFDVIVDLRPMSPTYGNWESFELRDDEQVSLYVPAGCAHGFQALTDPADVVVSHRSPARPGRRRVDSIRRPRARHPVAPSGHHHVAAGPARPAAGRRGEAAPAGQLTPVPTGLR